MYVSSVYATKANMAVRVELFFPINGNIVQLPEIGAGFSLSRLFLKDYAICYSGDSLSTGKHRCVMIKEICPIMDVIVSGNLV